MSDDVDDQDMSFAEGEAETAPAPKAKGAGPGILKILMFVGIALGAVILIVTVVVVTVGIMNKQQKPMSAVPASAAPSVRVDPEMSRAAVEPDPLSSSGLSAACPAASCCSVG